MLKVPIDRPLYPLQTFMDATGPIVPQVNVPQEYIQLVPVIASKVATRLNERANDNQARMYLLNLCSENGYNNPTYADVVEFTAWVSYLYSLKGLCQGASNCLEEALESALTLYVANVARGTPEVFSVLTDKQKQATEQNYNKYMTLIGEIDMYRRQPQQYPPQQMNPTGYPQQPMQQGYLQQMNPTGYPQQPMQQMNPGYPPQQQIQQPYAQPAVPRSYQQGYQQPAAVTQPGGGRFCNAPNEQPQQQPYNQQEPQSTPTKENNNTTTSSDISPEDIANLYPAPGHEYIPLVTKGYELAVIVDGNVRKFEINKENEMDRALHTITVGDVTLNSKERMTSIIEESEVLAQAAEQVKRSSAENKEIFKQKLQRYVAEDTVYSTNLDDMLLAGELSRKDYLGLNPVKASILQVKGTVLKPILVKNRGVEKLYQSKPDGYSLDQQHTWLTNRMDSYGLNEKSKLYRHVDTIYTNLVNDYLEKRLTLDLKITSFIEDWPELKDYLLNKFGGNIADKVMQWSRSEEVYIFNNVDETSVAETWNLLMEHTSEEWTIDTMPESYHITYIGLMDEELELSNIEEDGVRHIMYSVTPLLYNLAKAALDIEKDGYHPIHYLIVTKDGVVYEVFKGALNSDALLISKYHELD